jgi:hypothetical protein
MLVVLFFDRLVADMRNNIPRLSLHSNSSGAVFATNMPSFPGPYSII